MQIVIKRLKTLKLKVVYTNTMTHSIKPSLNKSFCIVLYLVLLCLTVYLLEEFLF